MMVLQVAVFILCMAGVAHFVDVAITRYLDARARRMLKRQAGRKVGVMPEWVMRDNGWESGLGAQPGREKNDDANIHY